MYSIFISVKSYALNIYLEIKDVYHFQNHFVLIVDITTLLVYYISSF